MKKKKIIGWREWASLPDLGITRIKTKIDTGARSSSLHASDIHFYKKNGRDWVTFTVHPIQRSRKEAVSCCSEILEFRKVRSSNGQSEIRPVITTKVILLKKKWTIELTLANRDEMGFRLLLGRQSFRSRFLVDAGKSYYGIKKKTSA